MGGLAVCTGVMRRNCFLPIFFVMTFSAGALPGRSQTTPSSTLVNQELQAPTTRAQETRSRPTPPAIIAYYGSVFAGPIASVASNTQGGGLVGASLGGIVAHRSLRAFTFPGFDMELAAIKPVQPGGKPDGIFSFDLQPGYAPKSERFVPYLIGGYSRVFISGNALNYGTGVNLLPKVNDSGAGNFFRVEARDYYTFASQRQHLVTFRIAYCFGIPDV